MNSLTKTQKLLSQTGALEYLKAKYLSMITQEYYKKKKNSNIGQNSAIYDSYYIANELVLQFLKKYNMKCSIIAFQNESISHLTSKGERSLSIQSLRLETGKSKKDPLHKLVSLMKNSPPTNFHDIRLVQSILLRVPNMIDQSTRKHLKSVLVRAGDNDVSTISDEYYSPSYYYNSPMSSPDKGEYDYSSKKHTLINSSSISKNKSEGFNLKLDEKSNSSNEISSTNSKKNCKNCNNILIEDASRSNFHLVLLPLSQSSEYADDSDNSTAMDQPFINTKDNFIQRGILDENDPSYTYIYESIDSESMEKLRQQNILNNELATPQNENDSEFTYIYETLSEDNQSEYTYIYTYDEDENGHRTNEYSYTYDEPSAGQIDLIQNQKNNKLNQVIKTRDILFDRTANERNIVQSPTLSISKQDPLFIQRSPKPNNNRSQQRRKMYQVEASKKSEKPKKLSQRKKLVLRKINLLKEQLRDLQSTTTSEFLSTETTEAENREDPKIKDLQKELSKITGKRVRNPNDSYSAGNSQYTYTYVYDEDSVEEAINNYKSKKNNSKQNKQLKSSPKDNNTRDIPNTNNVQPRQSPKSPNLVFQNLKDKDILISNSDIKLQQAEEQKPKEKVDLQISSSIQSEKVLKSNNKQIQPSTDSLDSNNIKKNDDINDEIQERDTNLNNEKHQKTIKKIYRKIKVNKPKKLDNYFERELLENSPKKARNILNIQSDENNDDSVELNDSELAILNPIDAKKYTETHSIQGLRISPRSRKAKKRNSKNILDDNNKVKIKVAEDMNVPDVDRFCIFYIEGDEQSVKRTKTIGNGQNSFDDLFEFPINESTPAKLIIFLKKQDLIKEDKIMGTTKIDLKKIPPNETLSKWVPLKSDSGVKTQSKIHLVLRRISPENNKLPEETADRNAEFESNSKKSQKSQNSINKNPQKEELSENDEIDEEESENKPETEEKETQINFLSENSPSYTEYSENVAKKDLTINDSNNEEEYSELEEEKSKPKSKSQLKPKSKPLPESESESGSEELSESQEVDFEEEEALSEEPHSSASNSPSLNELSEDGQNKESLVSVSSSIMNSNTFLKANEKAIKIASKEHGSSYFNSEDRISSSQQNNDSLASSIMQSDSLYKANKKAIRLDNNEKSSSFFNSSVKQTVSMSSPDISESVELSSPGSDFNEDTFLSSGSFSNAKEKVIEFSNDDHPSNQKLIDDQKQNMSSESSKKSSRNSSRLDNSNQYSLSEQQMSSSILNSDMFGKAKEKAIKLANNNHSSSFFNSSNQQLIEGSQMSSSITKSDEFEKVSEKAVGIANDNHSSSFFNSSNQQLVDKSQMSSSSITKSDQFDKISEKAVKIENNDHNSSFFDSSNQQLIEKSQMSSSSITKSDQFERASEKAVKLANDDHGSSFFNSSNQNLTDERRFSSSSNQSEKSNKKEGKISGNSRKSSRFNSSNQYLTDEQQMQSSSITKSDLFEKASEKAVKLANDDHDSSFFNSSNQRLTDRSQMSSSSITKSDNFERASEKAVKLANDNHDSSFFNSSNQYSFNDHQISSSITKSDNFERANNRAIKLANNDRESSFFNSSNQDSIDETPLSAQSSSITQSDHFERASKKAISLANDDHDSSFFNSSNQRLISNSNNQNSNSFSSSDSFMNANERAIKLIKNSHGSSYFNSSNQKSISESNDQYSEPASALSASSNKNKKEKDMYIESNNGKSSSSHLNQSEVNSQRSRGKNVSSSNSKTPELPTTSSFPSVQDSSNSFNSDTSKLSSVSSLLISNNDVFLNDSFSASSASSEPSENLNVKTKSAKLSSNNEGQRKKHENSPKIEEEETEESRFSHSSISSNDNDFDDIQLFKEDKIHDFTSSLAQPDSKFNSFNSSQESLESYGKSSSKKSNKLTKTPRKSSNTKSHKKSSENRSINVKDSLELSDNAQSPADYSDSQKKKRNKKKKSKKSTSTSEDINDYDLGSFSSSINSEDLSGPLHKKFLQSYRRSQNLNSPRNMLDPQDLSSFSESQSHDIFISNENEAYDSLDMSSSDKKSQNSKGYSQNSNFRSSQISLSSQSPKNSDRSDRP